MTSPASLDAALGPVRGAMLAAARRDADAEVAEAEEACRAKLAEARAAAERDRAQARAAGAADAAATVAHEAAGARARGRSLLLAARREEYDALHREARATASALCADPDYGVLRARMVEAVRRLLGAGARVDEAEGGGVVATAPGRRVDYSLATIADAVVDEIVAEMGAP